MKLGRKIVSIGMSGVLAFLCLSIITVLYYNMPAHAESETYSTNHVWEKNKWHSRGTEGFAFGRIDARGFNNVEVIDDVGILIMGSSQMEAFNVNYDQNTTYVLNELLEQNQIDIRAYNIGISKHDFINCVNNLQNAVKEFQPSHYVVIETMNYKFNINDMCAVVDGTFLRPAEHTKGILNYLQRFSYLRLLYRQVTSYIKNQDVSEKSNSISVQSEVDKEEYEKYLNALLGNAAETMLDGCKLVILLDKPLELNDTNDIVDYQEDYYYIAFRNACEENGIVLLDMHGEFEDFYSETHQFPNGFSNTRVGSGHLNKYGHQLIAKELLKIIMQGDAW